MERLLLDLRYGLRSLWRTPRLTLAALACIAIGVGATLAVLTLVNAVLLRPAPFPKAERLMRLWGTDAPTQNLRDDLSYPNFLDLKSQAHSFEALEASARTRLAVLGDEGAERLRGEAVSAGYFDLIGMRPARGRLPAPDEYRPGANRVMLISDTLWRNRFAGRPDVVGTQILARNALDRVAAETLSFTIIGVMPPGFTGTVEEDVNDFWIAIEQYDPRQALMARAEKTLWAIGRLRPGVTTEAAATEVAALGHRLAQAYPDENQGFGARAERFGENWRERFRTGLYLLSIASFLLLAIACTNIANLLLARLAQREGELTLRLVLGAERRRVLRQLLTESLLLAVAGGAVGVLLAYWWIQATLAFANLKIPSYVHVGLDLRLVLVALALIVLTGLAFGVAPALLGARSNANNQLRESGRGALGGRRQQSFGRFLVAAEVALTALLLAGAGLMLRSYLNLSRLDLGYRTDNLLRMSVTLDSTQFPTPVEWRIFLRKVGQVAAAVPGVAKVAPMAGLLPPWRDLTAPLALEHLPTGTYQDVERHSIGPEFLSTLDLHLLRGRNLEARDVFEVSRVALVSQSLERLIVGGEGSAVGKTFRVLRNPASGELSPPYEVVGVVGDVRYHGPRSDRPHEYDIFLSSDQVPMDIVSLAVVPAPGVTPQALIEPLKREIHKIAPTSPIHWVGTMQEELTLQYADSRFYAFLLFVYALSAVILASIGIFGVLSNSVSRRANEMGVRMAVGARPADVVRLVLGQGMRTVALGLAAGLLAALLSTRIMASLLFGVRPLDPLSLAVVVVGLLALSLVACYLPARRATRIDPVLALRQE